MTLRLPATVKDELRRQYNRAVKDCVKNFDQQAANEDGMTGALAGAFRREVSGNSGGYAWRTKATSLGRNKALGRQEEPDLGADLVVEIRYKTPSGDWQTKALLVQGKFKGDYDTDRLDKQCKAMDGLPDGHGRHIVVEYDRDGFTAVRSNVVCANGGSLAKSRSFGEPLGEALGGQFLNCRIGQHRMSYDTTRRRLRYPTSGSELMMALPVENFVETTIVPAGEIMDMVDDTEART